MGTEDFGRQFSRHIEQRWGQHRSGWAGDWSGGEGPRGRRGRPGPPPWVAELFGLAQAQPQRGPKVRRGDVRAAILDMLKDEPMNGYQLISQIMAAVWPIVTTGPGRQRRHAINILTETRRKLYGLLAAGDAGPADAADADPMVEGEEDEYDGGDR